MRCLPWPMVAGHGEERERCINGDILEEKIFIWRRRYLGEIFWEFGGRKRKRKEKGKRKKEKNL